MMLQALASINRGQMKSSTVKSASQRAPQQLFRNFTHIVYAQCALSILCWMWPEPNNMCEKTVKGNKFWRMELLWPRCCNKTGCKEANLIECVGLKDLLCCSSSLASADIRQKTTWNSSVCDKEAIWVDAAILHYSSSNVFIMPYARAAKHGAANLLRVMNLLKRSNKVQLKQTDKYDKLFH